MSKLAASTAKTVKPRGPGKPFVKGQSGNPKGRPVGSRQRLTEEFIEALSDDFTKHGRPTIKKMREEKPEAYVRVVADLVPRDLNLHHNASDAFVELWQSISNQSRDENDD